MQNGIPKKSMANAPALGALKCAKMLLSNDIESRLNQLSISFRLFFFHAIFSLAAKQWEQFGLICWEMLHEHSTFIPKDLMLKVNGLQQKHAPLPTCRLELYIRGLRGIY